MANFVTPCYPVSSRLLKQLWLMIGATIFGVGWGIAGYCPGIGVAKLTTGDVTPVIFLLSMVAGMIAFNRCEARKQKNGLSNKNHVR